VADNINDSVNTSNNPGGVSGGQGGIGGQETQTPPPAVPVGSEPSSTVAPSEPSSFGSPVPSSVPASATEGSYVNNLMGTSNPEEANPPVVEPTPPSTEPVTPPAPTDAPAGIEPVPDYSVASAETPTATPTGMEGMPPSQSGADASQSWTGEGAEISKKPNIWLPVVVLLIIIVAAVIYFIYANSSTTETTSTISQSSTTTGEETEVSTGTTATVSNDTTRKEDLTQIQEALEKYYKANQKYPVSAEITKTSDKNSVLTTLVPDYIEKLPTDPAGGESYYGYKSADGTTYELSAVFDEAPASVKSSQITSGYLVTLTPGIVFEQ